MRNKISGRKNRTHLNLTVLIVSAIVGAVMFMAGALVKGLLPDTVAGPALIALLFVMLYLVLLPAIGISSNLTGAYSGNLLNGKRHDAAGVILALAIGMAALALLGVLFEFLYELDFKKNSTEPSSYIFVIDDSGSMSANDPNGLRYAAIATILEGKEPDFPFMVYGFSNDAYIVQNMQTVAEGVPVLSGRAEGGTAIRGTLEKIADDYKAGIWDGGDNPRMILLTDGISTDLTIFLKSILKQYTQNHISISTVGLGEEVDTELLEKIASLTGGSYIHVSDVAQLADAMSQAAVGVADRTLLSARYTARLNVLYGIMRVLFLTVLGLVISFCSGIAYGHSKSFKLIMISGGIEAFAGALLMELGTSAGLPATILWLVLWVLIAATAGLIDPRGDGGYKHGTDYELDEEWHKNEPGGYVDDYDDYDDGDYRLVNR